MNKKEKTPSRDWGIYVVIIIGVIFMISAILYVINSEKPVETYPPTPTPTTAPTQTKISPPTTVPPTKPETVPPTTVPPTTTPPPPPLETKEKIKWVQNSIEGEMGEYTSDGRIGVQVRKIYNPTGYNPEESPSTAVEVLFENRTDTPQSFNLKKIYLFDKGGEKYKVQWIRLIMVSFEAENFETIKEIPPKNGLRVIFYFETLKRMPDYITFENYYYGDLESTVWKIKVRY
ncbi:MAG: hypothetical protein J7J21_02980 [Methanomicrobia archaeon]|nr:hypothetical protein [Methanomicrobia archaeon]